MELSEAIRKGSRLHPQAFGRYRDWHPHRGVIGTCALGAAAIAAGIASSNAGLSDGLSKHFPLLARTIAAMPCGCRPVTGATTIGLVVTHLNDEHQWRRTTIAQWVKSLEEGKGGDGD